MRKLTVSLTIAAAVGTGISPAMAAEKPSGLAIAAPAAFPPGTPPIVTYIQQAYNIYKQFFGGGNSAQLATQQIINAINNAKTDIINHIDAVAAANVKACAESAVINFASFSALTPDNQQAFALSATDCVTLANSLINTVTDKASMDSIGYAVDTVGPIALMARADTGLSNMALTPVLQNANQVDYNNLIPSCRVIAVREPLSPTEYQPWCTAYNGTVAFDSFTTSAQANAAVPAVRDDSAASISWIVAEYVLPQLS
jgi:hypothetical protein